MKRELSAWIVAMTIGLAGCGASRSSPNVATDTSPDRLTSATLTFASLQDGKDTRSSISVQLLRRGSELAADAASSGTEYKDNTTAAPIALALKGPFTRSDVQTGQVRLRLTPDGDDTWTFDVRLALRFADEKEQIYGWQSVRLDEKAPERTLALAGSQR